MNLYVKILTNSGEITIISMIIYLKRWEQMCVR